MGKKYVMKRSTFKDHKMKFTYKKNKGTVHITFSIDDINPNKLTLSEDGMHYDLLIEKEFTLPDNPGVPLFIEFAL